MSKKIFKSINLIRRGSGANLNLFRYAAKSCDRQGVVTVMSYGASDEHPMSSRSASDGSTRNTRGNLIGVWKYAAMLLCMLILGIGNAWAGHGGKCTAKLEVYKGTGSGSVYAATTGSATSGNSSVSADCGDDDNGTHTHTLYAFATPADGYTFLGWTESATSTAGADASNPKAVTITSESHNTVTKTLYAHFVEKAKVNITFEAPSNGTYTIAVNGGSAETVSSANVVKSNVTGVTLTATPASGYAFAGWYKLNSAGEFVEDLSIANPYDAAFTKSETIKMGARFVPTTLGKFILKGSETQYYGLKAATVAAGGSGTIVPVADETLVDGSDLMPFDNGTYNIKAGATLLVPYSSANTVQTAPVKINTTASATAISPYRKLILSDGVNIDCDGTICVGGQADAGNGGNPSGYVTGACGVIDMSKGGHIEMNNKSVLYCWGFIKGQDMDQGNNTVGAGTITANSGSVIWEDFSVGDWRGGTATSGFSGRFFPFQSYYIQNIEVPVTYKYGSTLKNFFTFNMSSSAQETAFDVIGSNTALFKLTDAQSLVRKWYDPTTDLVCYEVSGTAVLDYISLEVYITINSYDYDLPISSNMHIILTKCNLTLNRPMLVQPGGIIEIKNDANVTLATKIYMYDKDEWGPWISGKYYRSYGDAYPILTSHKNRGNGSSNADLDDATFLVDGTLTISSGAGLYSSTGGANIMGNGGGKVVFSSSLPSATSVKWYKGTKTSGDGEFGTTAMKAANLCNEDGSYTKSIASTTFHNVNGRWFTASAKDEKANHTYDFTYISSGAVSGTDGTSSTTDAVYSNDKTGMEARMKWANVTADACADWWHGQGDQAGWFYNWTMNSAWHQFQTTETEGMYSGSNNKIYTKTDCNWEELGETDVNCLYTIDGKKKALVDGHFIELEPNSDDAAFHEVADATKYYICFEGCNWHEATKIEGEKKAYAINEDNFIWYEDRWMQAEREIPFFYTYDETNVKVYYEYIGSEWVLAQPYVEVTDAIETRQLLRFNEAITVASGKKNATITLLRDLVNITTPMTFTGANTTCTLDLNGHVAEVHVVGAGTSEIKMLTLNGASTTFNITDNTTDKKGELKLIASVNTETSTKRWSGIYVQNGSLVLQSGKVYVEHPFAWVSNSNTGFIRGILVASAKTFTMNGGTLEVVSDYNTYGIESASGTPTVNINHGTIECIATKKDSPYGIIGYGTINIKNDSYIHANAKASSSSRGVSVSAGSSYQGTVNVTGGTIYSEATSSAQGIYCGGTAVVTGDYNATTPNNTPKNRYYAKANISGGTITAVCRTSTSSYGVLSYGTTTISGGTITSTVPKSNQNTAYGVCANGGTTTIKTGANITANAPANAYGLCSSAANGSSAQGWAHVGDLKVEGGTITANTTNGTTAYGLLVTGTTYTISRTDGYKVFNGDYAAAGTATVTGGTFYANAKTTLARGIAVAATKTKNEASATPKCTINGGYYKMTGTGDLLGCNASALAADFHINGGYYSHNGNLATYAASPKHVLTLASGDANRPPYYYKVAEAYQVTFKNEDGTANIIDPIYQEVNTKPVCSTEPTKASTSTNSFTFDGWATAANGNKVYEPNGLPNVTSAGATYYAHFATTTLKYRVHLDATENGGECATENIYVEPGTAVGTLPTATKYGYTFSGWFTAASGGTKLEATTVINANADYYAQFTVNSHTLTWDLAGGAVGTAGKIGSTTWPAKNATGTQSRSVAYGTVLTTIPVITKTGYVFNRWNPVPTSSMPDENVTYTALWNPATNTKYYVKHYQQNIDDDNYTLVETDELTGTTDATVTPDRKSYDGFLTPTPQQLTIGAAGTSELVYNYDRVVYTINWNASANGGTCATASTDVRHGATIALPAATKTGHILEGWYTKAEGGNKISDGATILQNYGTLYAQFIPTYTIIWNDENGNELRRDEKLIGESLTPPDYSKEDTQEWDYTFHGWNDGTTTYAANAIPAVSGAATYTADVTKVKNNYTLTIGVVEAGYGSVNETSVTVPYGTSVLTSDNVLTIGTTTVTATPTAKNAQYTYTFSTWQNVPTSVTGNVNNIQAVFTRTLNTVTVTWKNGDDFIETDEGVVIGTTPTFDGETPIKETDENFGYTFDGWDDGTTVYAADALPIVSGAVTYTAHYSTAPTVASVEVSGNTKYYTTIDAAFEAVNAASANMTITMLANATAAASLVYQPASTYTCTLDLNNHTISGAFTKLIDINLAKSTFIITDNSGAKGGKVDNNYNANARVYGVFLTAGTFKLQNGTISSTNPHTYSSTSANSSSAASGVYVTAGQTFTMENGTVESASQYASYAIYMAAGTSTVTIKNGLVKGRTTKSTTAAGIYNLGKGLTVDGGRIVGHAYTTTAYGIYLYGGHGTINGGTIEATNDTTSNKGSTTTYGIYVNYKTSTYKGVLTIPSTSTVNVFAKARTTTAYAIVVGGGSTGNTIAGGTFTAKTKTGKTAYCVNSSGNITISGGTFTANAATTNAYGIYAPRGTVTVNGNPTFNVTAGSTTAYGALAYGTIGKKGTGKYSGTIEINGGTFNVTSTAETAWGASAGLASRDLRSCSATNDTVPGLHYMPGILVVNDGTFNVKATTTGAFGIVVAKAKSESGTVGTTARIPLGTVTGGKFKVESMGDANATAYAMNSATTAARLVVQGGYYNTKRTDASETSNIEDKYTAPTKDCNYHVLDLPEEELPYKYKVAEAYTVTFKNGEDVLQSGLVEKNQTPEYTGTTPTKTATDQYTYTFNNTWSPAIVAVTEDATYTAQFGSTVNEYTITWVDGNGETLKTEQVEYGQTPAYTGATPTKNATAQYTYTFNNTWSPAIVAVTEAATYTAQFGSTVNEYTITWVDGNGATLKTEQVEYGQTPAYSGATPTKTATAQYTYTFNNTWSPAIVAVTGEATYTAQFNETPRQYRVTWDAATNSGTCATEYTDFSYNAAIGTLPVASKEGHTFNGWFTSATGGTQITTATKVTADVTYHAQFTINKYSFSIGVTPAGYGSVDVASITQIPHGTTVTSSGNTFTVNGTTVTATPTTADAQYTYKFDHWNNVPATATDNVTNIEAVFTRSTNTYTVTWKNGDVTLETDENVAYGATPHYDGATPTKTATAEWTYEFAGWDNEVVAVTGDVTYNATFNQTKNSYEITWLNDDNSLIDKTTVEYGVVPTHADATKANTAEYTYTFTGWDNTPVAVTGAATYKATFSSSKNQYTLTLLSNNDEWGTVDGGGLYDYNSAHTITASPKQGFKFVEWNDHVTSASREVTVTADVTYTATFDYDIANYTVKHWKQNIYDDDYTEEVADRQTNLSGTIGAQTNAEAKTYTGFTAQPISQQTIVVEGTTVVNIYYNRNTYTIEWQVDGVTKKNETVRYGATPSYGDDPTKAETAQYTYSFSGWSPTPYAADKDQIYSGTFHANVRHYTITWQNWNGVTLKTDNLQYGATPSYSGTTPTKTDSETERSYTFKGWSPEVVDVAGDATYTAQFDLALTIGEGEHPYEVSGEETATITTVLVQGALKVPDGNNLTTNDLIIMASADNSGDVEGVENVSVTGHAYFDYQFNVDPWHWSAFGVPFEIDLDAAAPLKDKATSMVLGTDYDIVYYNTTARAQRGPNKRNWEYVENHEHKLIPGVAYLIAFNTPVGHVNTVRFTKANGASINYTTEVPLTVTGAKDGDNNWNGIANPKMYHALLDAGVEECQVHDGGPINGDGYDLYTMKSGETDYKFFVGKAAFVQTPQSQSTVEIDPATNQSPLAKHNAPRRAGAFETVNPKYDIRIAPMDGEMADRLFIRAEEGKEDDYVIVADLAKAGVSPKRAQLWVDRYGYQLCKNTTALINDQAAYPLGISVPQAGEYRLYVATEMAEDDNLYLTYDGRVIWNIGYAPYVLSLEKGETAHYGLLLIHSTPSMEMDVDQVEATRAAQKMLINQKVYILRGEQLYYITGQKAE